MDGSEASATPGIACGTASHSVRTPFDAINASKAGGDDAMLVDRIAPCRRKRDPLDLTNANFIRALVQ